MEILTKIENQKLLAWNLKQPVRRAGSEWLKCMWNFLDDSAIWLSNLFLKADTFSSFDDGPNTKIMFLQPPVPI